MKAMDYFLIAALATSTVLFSCKKSSDSSSSVTSVEYQITPMNSYFTQISIDSIGTKVVITDPSKFVNGSKVISVTTKPFLASIETTINNTTNSSINYSLAILVDGQAKNIVSVSAPAGVTSTGSVNFTVQ